MKAIKLIKPGVVRVVEVDRPQISDDEVLLKMIYCGVCGSDVMAFKTGIYGTNMIIGHEVVGEVVEKGKNVDIETGSIVTAGGVIPCGSCPMCMMDRKIFCINGNPGFGVLKDGGYAQYFKVEARFIHRVPEGLTPLKVVPTDPLTNVIYASRIAQVKESESFIIIGAGSLGLLLLQYLCVYKPSMILIADIVEEKLRVAKRLVPQVYTVNPLKENIFVTQARLNPQGFDVLFDCAGAGEVVADYLTLLKPGGRVCIVALHTTKKEIDLMSIVLRELKISGGHASFYSDHEYALRLLKDGVVKTDEIITDVIPLSKVTSQTFKKISGIHKGIKTVIDCRR